MPVSDSTRDNFMDNLVQTSKYNLVQTSKDNLVQTSKDSLIQTSNTQNEIGLQEKIQPGILRHMSADICIGAVLDQERNTNTQMVSPQSTCL